jgi:putative transposase
MIEWHSEQLPLCQQAELLGVSRSSLYYRPVGVSAREVALKHRIDQLYTAHPFYGSRKITAILNRETIINRKTVRRYMRDMQIAALHPGPKLSQPNPSHAVYPYLLRGVTSQFPNHIWGIDITYIRLRDRWMYLVAVLDWFSRYVVSWELDASLQIGFVLSAVERALAQARPQICNSDQGSHFTSPQYLERLQAAQVQISMDGRGRAQDNIFTERLWRTVKYEEVYLHDYAHPQEAYQSLSDYLSFYNFERPHQALGYCTPAQVYYQTAAATGQNP